MNLFGIKPRLSHILMPQPIVYLLFLAIFLQAGVQSTPLLISPYRNWRVRHNLREHYTRTKSDKRSISDIFNGDLDYREAPPPFYSHSLVRRQAPSILEELENSEETNGYEVRKSPILLWTVKRYYYYLLKRADDSKKALLWPESLESMEQKWDYPIISWEPQYAKNLSSTYSYRKFAANPIFYRQRKSDRDLDKYMQLYDELNSDDDVVETLEEWIRRKRVSGLDWGQYICKTWGREFADKTNKEKRRRQRQILSFAR